MYPETVTSDMLIITSWSFISTISFKIIWNLPLVRRRKEFNPCFLKRSEHIFSFANYYIFLRIFPKNIGMSIESYPTTHLDRWNQQYAPNCFKFVKKKIQFFSFPNLKQRQQYHRDMTIVRSTFQREKNVALIKMHPWLTCCLLP